ncbi:hydantoinase/oxoprolinase family protein [Gaiella sp.]|uniref:hydantoinase/oxoprolinase family protein n=1 Tax=Gaiella sp. TaxID=2663207 RepID=UPI0039831561
MARAYRLGIDIGGTFTDVVLLGDDGSVRTKKVLSTPDDYARGVVGGAVSLLAECDVAPADVAGVVHASTVASNTILEGLGARTALITTEGFRDVLEMRRLRIPVLYDIQYEGARPLVPRRLRYEVPERLGPRGEIWRELDEARVSEVAQAIAKTGVEAVAIALMHAYANDTHERRVEEIVRAIVGQGVYITRSSEILPEIREYERTSTAVVNAYVGPAITRYIASLAAQLRGTGITAPLEVIQSAGGTLTPEIAARKPAHLVESGPAAGVMACAYLGRLTGRPQLISLDMGGTTAKAAIVEDGQPVRTSEYEVGAGINLSSKLVKGGGHPIKLPFIDVSEIGAGGGSIVSVDPLGAVSVGPVSAGSMPGPVCYDLGGLDPTLTDALLALGYLNETQLGDGAITLNPSASREALDRIVAAPLSRSVEEAAHGILQLAVATMTRAVKAVTTYRGRDPRDFTLCAFGGNGPLTGVEIARALQIRRVLIPPAPGVFSALGLLFSDTEHETVRTLMLRGAEVTPHALESSFAAIEAVATASLVSTDGATVTVARYADVRYAGQAYELPVRVAAGTVDIDRLTADFVAEHIRTYGHGSADDPIDVVSVRALARIARTTSRRYDPVAAIRALPPLETVRWAYFGPGVGHIETPVCNRAGLLGGERRGPLLIDEIDSTCVVPPGCVARLDAYGNIEVEIDG